MRGVTRYAFPVEHCLPPRPATLSEVLDAGLLLFRRSFIGCLPWSLLAVLLGQLPSVYLLSSRQPLALDAPKDVAWWALMGLSAIGTLFCWIVLMLRQRAVLSAATGDRPSLAGDLRHALRCLPAALATLAIGAVLVAVGLVLLIVPGVYLLVAFWPVLALVVFEGAGPRAALDGALQLVRGAWRALGITLLVVVMTLMGLFVVGGLVGFVVGADVWARGLLTALLGAAFQPLFIAFGLAAYADLRQRQAQRSSSASSSA